MAAVLTSLKVLLFLLVGLVGLWLGWYYGAILGYWIWPDSLWKGGVFSYLVGMPLGTFTAWWLATKTFRLAARAFRPKHSEGPASEQ